MPLIILCNMVYPRVRLSYSQHPAICICLQPRAHIYLHYLWELFIT